MGHFNRGIEAVDLSKIPKTRENSCQVEGNVMGVERKLKISYDKEKWSLWIDQTHCFTMEHPDMRYDGYIGFTAGNRNGIRNQIDIRKVKVINTNENFFRDDNESLRVARVKLDWDDLKEGTDLLHQNVDKTEEGKKEREAFSKASPGIMLRPKDTRDDVLFKFYEVIQSYSHNLETTHSTLNSFDEVQNDYSDNLIHNMDFNSLTRQIQKGLEIASTVRQEMFSLEDKMKTIIFGTENSKKLVKEQEIAEANDLISQIENLSGQIKTLEKRLEEHMARADDLMAEIVQSTTDYKVNSVKAMEHALSRAPGALVRAADDGSASWMTWIMVLTVFSLLICVVVKFRSVNKAHGL